MTTLETVISAEHWLDQAIATAAAGELAEARVCLQNALETDPQNGELILAAGHVLLGMKDLADALKHYSAAVRLLPFSANSHASRALALQLLGRSPEAEAAARLALSFDQKNIVALKVMTRICLDANRHAEAKSYCQQVLKLTPDDVDALKMHKDCQSLPTQTSIVLPAVSPLVLNASLPASAEIDPKIALFGESNAQQPRSAFNFETQFDPTDERVRRLLDTLLQKVGFRALQRIGFHVQRNDYYSPLNDCDFLEKNPDLWNNPETPAEIDWQLEEQLQVAREVAPFVGELQSIPAHPPTDCSSFGWKNNFWENADALFQYGLVRSRRPKRYVEIGCGWSSLLLKKALAHNAEEGHHTRVTLIEPFPNQAIFKHLPRDWKIHRAILQRASFEVFDQLEAGDFLFYDGSHCSKVASDVNWFFFKILPRLKPGVIIHIHDISLPQEYPPPWIFDRGQTWNEQYVLQAFLMHNQAYKILVANRYLFCHRPDELEKLFQKIQPVHGSSFWMQKSQTLNPPAPAEPRQDHVVSPRPSFASTLQTSSKNGMPQKVCAPTLSRIPQPFVLAEIPSRNGEAASPILKIPDQLKKLEGLMGNYSARTETWGSLGPEHLMQQLVVGNFQKSIDISAGPGLRNIGPDGFPVPPVDLTMGYGAGDLKHYLSCGRKSYEILTQLLKNHQAELRVGDSLLDWGGAAGRVVRNFTQEARQGCEIWGCDVHAPSIQWAQNHLSPPFKFFNSSSLPHLPFPENSFKAIYGLSVMTHLITLRDLWLLELGRILKPDGCLILTIHNEDTWAWFRKHGMPNWMPAELRDLPEMPGECVEIRGSRWEHCYTFFHSDYIRRIWGQLLDVKEIVPCADAYQAAVIMKKPTREKPSIITTHEQR